MKLAEGNTISFITHGQNRQQMQMGYNKGPGAANNANAAGSDDDMFN